jgi:hypothetical protein
MGGAVAVVAVTVFCQQVDAVLAAFLGLLFSLILRLLMYTLFMPCDVR